MMISSIDRTVHLCCQSHFWGLLWWFLLWHREGVYSACYAWNGRPKLFYREWEWHSWCTASVLQTTDCDYHQSWCLRVGRWMDVFYVSLHRRTFQRLKGCGVEIQLGCNYQQVSPRELVLSMFQKIDTNFDLVLIQSEKPLVMIKWVGWGWRWRRCWYS